MRVLFNKLSNLFIKPILRSPLHFIASGSIVLISFTGRKSGNTYTTPVEYKQLGNTLTVFTRKNRTWWRNLQGGAPIRVWLHGQEINGLAETPIIEIGELFQTIKWMYPRMNAEQIAELMPELIMIQIHLPQAAVVPVH